MVHRQVRSRESSPFRSASKIFKVGSLSSLIGFPVGSTEFLDEDRPSPSTSKEEQDSQEKSSPRSSQDNQGKADDLELDLEEGGIVF